MNKSTDTALPNLQEENEKLRVELDLYKNKLGQANSAYSQLLHSFKEFQRNRFGSKSERFVDSDNPQADLFAALADNDFTTDEDDTKSNENDENKDDNVIDIAAHKRRKKKNFKFPDHLPRREVIIKAEDQICTCGKEKKLIRYETTELLNCIPEVFEVIEQKREVLACSCGCNSITTAPLPKRILPRVKITESTLAHIIVSKLDDRQPLYHQEKRFDTRFGIDLPRNTLARWFIESAKALQPLINLIKDEIIECDVASCDATGIQVLDEPGREPTKKSYLYCMRGGRPDKKVIFYDYNATKHKLFLANWFDGFFGFLHTDAQNIFDDLENSNEHSNFKINLVYCNAHARRKFEKIAKATKTDGLAKIAMRVYKKLYKIERALKNTKEQQKLSPEEFYQLRHKTRQEKSKPIMEEFKIWLDKNHPETLPESPLGKAFFYALKHWGGLIRFLEDGKLEADNNHTEQQIKPVVIARKNFLFCKSIAGVKAVCNHMSLIRTAIEHGFDPYRYYVEICKKIPNCQTLEDYEKLLPWNIELEKVRKAKKSRQNTAA